jgi:ABC-type Mn2+/Zn2+ transport system permease subunit
MLESLQYDFMRHALMAAVLVGGVCSIIGVYVVLKGLSFIGDGVAHASFGGVALGFLLGINPLVTSVIFAFVMVGLVAFFTGRGKMKTDPAIGVFFSFMMALAILFIGLMRSYNAELYSYLFGSIISVTTADLAIMLALSILVLGTVAAFFKELLYVTFDPEMALASGVRAGYFNILILSMLGLTIVISMKSVGMILVLALIVIPASCAQQITRDIKRIFILSPLFGVTSSVGGLFLSYYFDLPSGATIVIILTLMFFLTAIKRAKG